MLGPAATVWEPGAFIVGYRAVMAVATGLALASAAVAWLMIRPTNHGGGS